MYALTRTETRPSTNVQFFLQTVDATVTAALSEAMKANEVKSHVVYSPDGLSRAVTMTAPSKEDLDAFRNTEELQSYFDGREAYNNDMGIVAEVVPSPENEE